MEHDEMAAGATVEGGSDRSVAKNLVDVIVEPSATFEDVAEHPRWLAPLLIMMGLTLLVTALMIGFQGEMQRVAFLASKRAAGLTPEQKEQALQAIEKFKYVGVVIAPIAFAIFSALFGLLFWGWAAITGAKNAEYQVAFTAIVYTGVIGFLQSIAQAIVIAIKGADVVAAEGGAPTFGLALLMERGDMSRWVWAMLANVNFFSIWSAVLMAIAGVHALKMGKGASWAFAIFLWLVMGLLMSFQFAATG